MGTGLDIDHGRTRRKDTGRSVRPLRGNGHLAVRFRSGVERDRTTLARVAEILSGCRENGVGTQRDASTGREIDRASGKTGSIDFAIDNNRSPVGGKAIAPGLDLVGARCPFQINIVIGRTVDGSPAYTDRLRLRETTGIERGLERGEVVARQGGRGADRPHIE